MAYSKKIIVCILIFFTLSLFIIPFSFAQSSHSTILDSDIDIPDWLYDYNFQLTFYHSGSYYYCSVVYTSANNTLYYEETTAPNQYFITLSSVDWYNKTLSGSKDSLINDLANLQNTGFNSHNTTKVFQYHKGDSYYEQLRNFTVYDYTNQDVVYSEPNTSLYIPPKFDNPVSDIENLQFSYLLISPNSYGVSEPLYLHRLEVSYIVPTGNSSTYYYSDKIFNLDSSSPYFEELGDSGSGVYYYGIPFYKFEFLKDSQYVLFLSSSSESINNSNGAITSSFRDDIFQLVNIDTTNKLTDNQVITSFYQNNSDNTQDIVDNTQDTKDNTDDIKESTQNIEGFLTDGSVSSSTQSDINSSLNFDNSNDALNNQNSGFFTRLTSLVSSLATYNLGDDTSVSIPLPNSHGKVITLHSQDIYNGVNGTLRSIINAFWLFVFMFYLWRFINKIYIAVSTGNILDTFSSSGEAITQSML